MSVHTGNLLGVSWKLGLFLYYVVHMVTMQIFVRPLEAGRKYGATSYISVCHLDAVLLYLKALIFLI
jgi:hypothetical protein